MTLFQNSSRQWVGIWVDTCINLITDMKDIWDALTIYYNYKLFKNLNINILFSYQTIRYMSGLSQIYSAFRIVNPCLCIFQNYERREIDICISMQTVTKVRSNLKYEDTFSNIIFKNIFKIKNMLIKTVTVRALSKTPAGFRYHAQCTYLSRI